MPLYSRAASGSVATRTMAGGGRLARSHRFKRGCLIRLLLAALCGHATAAYSQQRSLAAQGLDSYATGHVAEALLAWRDASAAGDASAALFLGAMYDTGQGVPRNYGQALAWYVRAAEAGSVAAMFNVGVMHDAGLGTPQDRAEAARWYARASAQGYGRADYALALMHRDGSGVRRDPARAAQLFRAAADHGIAAARAHLAERGRGAVRQSGAAHPTAGRFGDARDAALREFDAAQSALLRRKPEDAVQDASLYRAAAEARNPVAEYDLGYCYEMGLGVVADDEQAHAWYRRAAGDAKDEYLRAFAADAASKLESKMRAVASGRVSAPTGLADGGPATPRYLPAPTR